MVASDDFKKQISRLRSEVRKLVLKKAEPLKKTINPFTGIVSGNYWTQTGMPWVSGEGRKAVMTEYFWQPIRGQPRRVDTNELRQFSMDFWVSSCVKTLMDEIATLEWDVVPKENVDYNTVLTQVSIGKEFLKHPNKNCESFQQIIRQLIKDILEIDAGCIIKVFDINSYDFNDLEPKSGAPMLKPLGQRKMTEVYIRDGASFLKEIDKFGFLKGFWQYSYQIPAHPMWFNRDEVVYCSEQPRSMSPYGYARTQAILDIIKSLHYSTLYNKRFFEESPIPDGALALLDTNEVEMKEFMQYWNNEFKAQPHKLAVINKDIRWMPFNVSNRELEFLDTQKWYYNMVVSMFGLAPSEMGMTETVNKATASTQVEVIKRKGVRPFLKLLEGFINDGLMVELGIGDVVEFQFIYDDPGEKHQKLANWEVELRNGIKTVNEVRVEMGLAPVEGGDMSNNWRSYIGGMPSSPQAADAESKKKERPDNDTPENERRKDDTAREEEQAPRARQNTEANQGKFHRDRTQERSNKEQDDVKNRIRNPYSDSNRPVGSFKNLNQRVHDLGSNYGFDPNEVNMGLKEEQEHADTVDNNEDKIMQIVLDHLKEDPHYYTKLREVFGKGVADGQYYNEVTNMRRLPRSAIVQPQNYVVNTQNSENHNPQTMHGDSTDLPVPMRSAMSQYVDTDPSQLGSDYRALTGKETYSNKDQIHCPMCGQPTLSMMEALETDIPDDMRCTQCGARFRVKELIEAKMLEEMSNVLNAHNAVEAVSIPSWSPK